MMEPMRIVLLERAPRRDYAVSFDAESFVVEGVALLPDRRVALRDVYGIERAGAWLWVGAGFVPAVLGGADARAERLARVEAELRARIAALPGGAGRLARIDARRAAPLARPWLTAALALGLGAAAGVGGAFGLRAAADLLWLLAVGLVAEPTLGALRLAASGGVALLTACAVGGAGAWLALAPGALALGWAALLVSARLRREPVLGVRARSTLDGGLLLALALAAHALGAGAAARALAAAALAAALLAPLLLRRWPGGTGPH
jgi:hypothetical protein